MAILLCHLVLYLTACGAEIKDQSPPTVMETAHQTTAPVVMATSVQLTVTADLEPPAPSTVPAKSIETSQLAPSAILSPVPLAIVSAVPLTPTIAAVEEVAFYSEYVIGHSGHGLPLTAHQFNDGPNKIVIVGGIHGGYEWNTILLAYDLIEYFKKNPLAVPDPVALIIIPTANPEGLEKVTGKTGPFDVTDLAMDTFPGRFNGNDVDLNRNWDCNWQSTGIWRGENVSGGTEAFSEMETRFLRDFFLQQRPKAVIFLHSAANGVFASGCPDTHQPSMDLARTYGAAAGYPVYERFSAYEVTGDAGDWLSEQGFAAISVELIDHEYHDMDREQNFAGVLAVLEPYN